MQALRDDLAQLSRQVTTVLSASSDEAIGEVKERMRRMRDNIGETVEGLQRFPINVRYPRETRDSVEMIRALPVLTERGAQIRLSDVAAIRIAACDRIKASTATT